MPITFSLTADDFTRFQKVVARRFRQKTGLFSLQFLLRVIVWMFIGFAGAGYARLMTANPDIEHELSVIAFFLIGAIIAITAMPHLSQALLRRHLLSPKGAFLSPQTVEFTDSSLVVSSAISRTELPWSALHAKMKIAKTTISSLTQCRRLYSRAAHLSRSGLNLKDTLRTSRMRPNPSLSPRPATAGCARREAGLSMLHFAAGTPCLRGRG